MLFLDLDLAEGRNLGTGSWPRTVTFSSYHDNASAKKSFFYGSHHMENFFSTFTIQERCMKLSPHTAQAFQRPLIDPATFNLSVWMVIKN
jgi:hypothetical protein